MLSQQPHITTRWAEAKDCTGLQSIFRACWSEAYAGIIPAGNLSHMIAERDASWWQPIARRTNEILLLEASDSIAGYARLGPCRGRWRASGEIYELYVLPIFQGCGLGEHLFEAARQHLDARDTKGLIVWTLADNTRAIDFYWRRGGRPIAKAQQLFGTKMLTRIAFAWS